MRKSTQSKPSLSKSFPISNNDPRSSETLESNSTVELPSSLREHFEKTKDFEWIEDFSDTSPMISSGNLNISGKYLQNQEFSSQSIFEEKLKNTGQIEDISNDLLGEGNEIYKDLLSRSLMGCIETPEVFYRRNIFDNQLERIIEEVSNEAFSSFLNRSTVFLNSSMNKPAREIIGSVENPSRENLLSLNQKYFL